MGRGVWHLPSPSTPLQNTSESPTSPKSPLSPPLHTPPPLHSPTSPSRSSSNGLLIPPPRLHLRTIIPSPPLPPEYLATAPPLPYSWVWRCHLCHSIYRLGVTRRCLEDGHFFCSLPSPPVSPITPPSASLQFPSSASDEDGQGKGKDKDKDVVKEMKKARRRASKSKKKKKLAARGCRAEFDYGGWSKYNIWRREVRLLKKETTPVTRSKTKLIRDIYKQDLRGKGNIWAWDLDAEDEGRGGRRGGGRDCWRDCDFPSECHNERKAEREWEARIRETRLWEESWREEILRSDAFERLGSETSFSSSSTEVDESEDGGSMDIDIGLDLAARMAENDVDFTAVRREGKKEGESENLGPLGTDCDGLGEAGYQAEYTRSMRRKSVESLLGEGSPPNSPLKECSFGFEDLVGVGGCEVWQDEREYGEGDMQMMEVKAGRSQMLRRVVGGAEEERFGDEEL